MIGSIRGRLATKQAPTIIVECAGVGYEIQTPMSTFLELPELGAEVQLQTHLVVREDAHTLYGFSTDNEKHLFRALLKINGVGAKMALGILSGMSVADFSRCVQHEDTAMLVKIPGVGKKTAERLIIEMRDRVDGAGQPVPMVARHPVKPDARSEAFDALVALGYKPAEVKRLLGNLGSDEMSAEDMIRHALRQAVN
ncbi:MAG: Holliday junction branch migration protein RuvA [Gammaproteobacteria bacterium]|nr:Holliday junction branch migration protein RuvA [Gammaproteobacteria bacterium]MDH4256820.1 Holliday junction branch migration protein RuvA [Gammaproteobacteria bacterium]